MPLQQREQIIGGLFERPVIGRVIEQADVTSASQARCAACESSCAPRSREKRALEGRDPPASASRAAHSSRKRHGSQAGSFSSSLYSPTIRWASGTVVGSGSVGPEASADSWPSGTSVIASVNFIDRGAAAARRPPFVAERCLRITLISSMGAPQVTSAECNFRKSSSVAAESSGCSTSDEPPPESRKENQRPLVAIGETVENRRPRQSSLRSEEDVRR